MDPRKKHRRRVSFSDVMQDRPEESLSSRNTTIKSESFRQGSWIMKEYNSKESEFAASIAAAAYAIYSLEETRAEFERRMVESFREDPDNASNNSKIRRDSLGSNNFELPNIGSLVGRSTQGERRPDFGSDQDSIIRDVTSTRNVEISGVTQRRREGMTKAEAWELARLDKINKWYEKMNKKIIEWENEKKKKANNDMEKRKEELERLKRLNLQHYLNKRDWIEDVAEGAKKQLVEKKRREEMYAKQQAQKIRSTGRVPVQCFCFEY